jgi:hypothetical protein
MTDKPYSKIYLQCCDEDGEYICHEPGAEVTWCQDKINRHDVEYVLASDFYALRERVQALEGISSAAMIVLGEITVGSPKLPEATWGAILNLRYALKDWHASEAATAVARGVGE